MLEHCIAHHLVTSPKQSADTVGMSQPSLVPTTACRSRGQSIQHRISKLQWSVRGTAKIRWSGQSKCKPDEALRVWSGGKGSSLGVVVVGVWQVKTVGLWDKAMRDGAQWRYRWGEARWRYKGEKGLKAIRLNELAKSEIWRKLVYLEW